MSGSAPLLAPGPLRAEVARKAIHLATASVPLALAHAWIPASGLRWALLVLALVALVAEAGRRLMPPLAAAITRVAGTLFRERERRGITGATWLAVAMAVAAWSLPEPSAIAALWAVAVGDSAAALAGRLAAAPGGKTLIGSLACVVATMLGVWWLTPATPGIAALIGLAASVAERLPSRIDDNLRVTAGAGVAAWLLGVA